jgi:predicted nucleic acid-binding protein
MQRRFLDRGGRRDRVVADFLIGAHALLQCDALVTRDASFFRDYFKGLKVIEPRRR